MSKIKSRLKILRRLNSLLPSLTTKKLDKYNRKRPGEHSFFRINKTSTKLNYTLKLKEKQKLKFNYILKEKQLKNYLNLIYKNYRIGSDIIKNLYNLLELRFDCIIFRLGFSKTILEARQMINHKHFFINDKKLNIPGFICKINDIIFTNFIIAKNNFETNRKINGIPKHFHLLDLEKIIIKYNPVEFLKKEKIENMFTKTFEYY